jgi:hypothetical protein
MCGYLHFWDVLGQSGKRIGYVWERICLGTISLLVEFIAPLSTDHVKLTLSIYNKKEEYTLRSRKVTLVKSAGSTYCPDLCFNAMTEVHLIIVFYYYGYLINYMYVVLTVALCYGYREEWF